MVCFGQLFKWPTLLLYYEYNVIRIPTDFVNEFTIDSYVTPKNYHFLQCNHCLLFVFQTNGVPAKGSSAAAKAEANTIPRPKVNTVRILIPMPNCSVFECPPKSGLLPVFLQAINVWKSHHYDLNSSLMNGIQNPDKKVQILDSKISENQTLTLVFVWIMAWCTNQLTCR